MASIDSFPMIPITQKALNLSNDDDCHNTMDALNEYKIIPTCDLLLAYPQ